MIEKSRPLRSIKHLRLVASLPCASCGTQSGSQAAHRNEGKGMGLKACDSQTFPMCPHCHHLLDQSGSMRKAERRAFEAKLVDDTRQYMIEQNIWAADVEVAYLRANKDKVDVCAHK